MMTLSPDQLAAIRQRRDAREAYREFAHGDRSPAEVDVVSLLSHIDSQAAELAALRKRNGKNEKAWLEAIDERDAAHESLAQTHMALGGDGEWVTRLPREDPPDSGNLLEDVPELAAQYKATCDSIFAKPIGVPVPASVLAAVGEELRTAVYGFDYEWSDKAQAALESLKPYLPAPHSPEK